MGELAALPTPGPPELALAGGRLSSDERLARLVSRGSERAFAVLYQRHHQALYRYCRSIVRDEDDAQDALQSAMTRAFVALRARERDLAVRPWLFRIAHNEAVSVLRRRRPTVALVEELEPVEDLGVEGTLEERERLATLLADLQALPVRQRSALVMRELSGLSIEEIAGALSSSPGAAKQVLFEARSALHDFAEGRAMECEQVRQAISEDDRRVLRGRRLRGHLRECASCRDFQVAISTRSADLRALAPPLPGALAAGLLGRLLAHGVGGGHTGGLAIGAGGAAGGSGAAVGNTAAASLTVKAVAGVSALTVALAGGTQLALLHARHGHPHPWARSAARLAPPFTPATSANPATAAKTTAGTRHAAPAGAGAPTVTGRLRTAGAGALPGAFAPASSPQMRAAPNATAGVERGGGANAMRGLQHGRSRSQGHGQSALKAHGGGSRRPRAERRQSHRSRSSHSPQHGAGAKHGQAPAHPVQSKPPHGHGGEAHEPPAAPASGSGAQQAAGAPASAPVPSPGSHRRDRP